MHTNYHVYVGNSQFKIPDLYLKLSLMGPSAFSAFPFHYLKKYLKSLLYSKLNSRSSISLYLNLLCPWPSPSLLLVNPSCHCSDHRFGRLACLIFLLRFISNLSGYTLGISYKIYLESDHLTIPPLIAPWSGYSSLHLDY